MKKRNKKRSSPPPVPPHNDVVIEVAPVPAQAAQLEHEIEENNQGVEELSNKGKMMEEANKEISNQVVNHAEELVLSPFVYWEEFRVEESQCYSVTGYIRTVADEKKDAAVIFFNFEGYSMSKEECARYGLTKSKAGIYSYLPVGSSVNTWIFNIQIPAGVDRVRIGFRKWENNDEVIVGKNITLTKSLVPAPIGAGK
jgi:hypothetical protein